MKAFSGIHRATVALVLTAGVAHAQAPALVGVPEATERTLPATRVTDPIHVDGRLDETAWHAAPPATRLTQQSPNPGAPASQRTEARVLYRSDAIYVGMRMYDTSPDSIAAQLARRDASGIYSDWAHVFVDSYHDRRTAFQFSVTPRGVQRDVFRFSDTREDASWDAVWEVSTRIDSLGWIAEFRIPLSQLRFDPHGQVWGVNFGREIARLDEAAYWSPIPPDAPGFVSEFGELTGLRGLKAQRRLEVQPYSVARLTREPGRVEDPFYSPNDLTGSVGADVRYGLTSDLTLTATINPDFGQVEADPAVVNLTAFETFFPERRPFFQEGTDIFQFDLAGGGDLFYSRRIGRRPQGSTPGDAVFRDSPESTTILGAAKLSGKTVGGWSVGILDALTGREQAHYVTAEGLRRKVAVEPLTNYGVARVMRDFREGQSSVGGIFTATNRQLDGDRLDFLRSAAYTGGIDAHHRFGGVYRISGYLLGSYIRGSEQAISLVQQAPGHYFQRPDASHLEFVPDRTSLGGWATSLHLDKIGGNWKWGIHNDIRSPGFEINDLGFQGQADLVSGRGYIGYTDYEPGRTFRRWSLFTNNYATWTFGGEQVATIFNLNGSFQLTNFWGGAWEIAHAPSALSTTALRGGPALVEPARSRLFGLLHTDRRKPINGSLAMSGANEIGTDGWALSISPRLDIRPSPRVELSLGPTLYWNTDAWQYVDQRQVDERRNYFFGQLEQTTAALTARLSYTLTPDLSLQFYAQPFVSAGAYDRFLLVQDVRAEQFEKRFRILSDDEVAFDPERGRYQVDLDGDSTFDTDIRNPTFNVKQLRSNAVLRWEYRPGSTLFVVWNHGQRDFALNGDFNLWSDTRELFTSPSTNVVLIKVSYWLGL